MSRDDARQVRKVFDENFDMRDWLGPHEFFVHVRLPGERLNVLVGAHTDKALAALIVAVPKVLHHAKHPEYGAMRCHEAFARRRECPRVAGL